MEERPQEDLNAVLVHPEDDENELVRQNLVGVRRD